MSNNLNKTMELFERFLDSLRGLSTDEVQELVDQALFAQPFVPMDSLDILKELDFTDMIPVDRRGDRNIVCPNCSAVFTSQDL